MAQIPLNTQFIGLADTVDTTERRSALINSESAAYTMQDIIDSVGGGLEGSSYVFVAADGTDVENAAALKEAYDLAETKVVIETITNNIPLFYMNPQFNVSSSVPNTSVSVNFNYPFPYPSGQTYDWVINGVTYSGYLNSYVGNVLSISFFGVPNGNYNNLAILSEIGVPATVIVAPGLYNFGTDFIADKPYVNIVSLDGNRSVILNGVGTIQVDADDIFVKGIDVKDKPFIVSSNLITTVIENCKGGDYSFSDPNSIGLACILNNCEAEDYSFGYRGNVTGTLTNCKGGDYSFGASQTTSYSQSTGTFIECEAGQQSFEYWNSYTATPVTAKGQYIRCKGGDYSFGSGSQNAYNYNKIDGLMLNCQSSKFTLDTSGTGLVLYCLSNNFGIFTPINFGFTVQDNL
jgi:hypothetical protein